MRTVCSLAVSLGMIFACGTHAAQAQTRANVVDLFSSSATDAKRADRAAKAVTNIPGMRADTVGAVSILPLSSAGTRSMRAARSASELGSLRIALPNAPAVVCNLTPEARAGGVVAMQGTTDGGSPFDRCNLYLNNGQITGDIDTEKGRFAIVPLGTQHAIVEVKTQAFPNESEPLPVPDATDGPARDLSMPDCDVRPAAGQAAKVLGPLRVMVVYSPPVAKGINIATAVEQLRDQLKEAFARKDGNFVVTTELVHAEEVAYNEPRYSAAEKQAYSQKAGFKMERDMDIDLWRVTDPQDAIFKRIHEVRARHKAHIVHLITMRDTAQNGCGLGWVVRNMNGLAARGFSTSNRQCALQNFSFAHEVGHNIGMNHDRSVAGTTRPGDYNFGYVLTEKCVRSVMAYDNACRQACASQSAGCRRLNIFSSPHLRYPDGAQFGKPLADPLAAHNNEVLCRVGTVLQTMR
jgi:hypothetical protein